MGQHAADILRIAVLALCSSLATAWASTTDLKADLIVIHARVYTVDAKHPWADAIAVRDQRIMAVGTDAQIAGLRGPKTVVVDAQQHLVLPGFFDSHIHFMQGALSLQRVNLDETKTVAEILSSVRAFAKAHPADPWVLGRGWSYPEFPGSLPDKKYLGEIIPDRPVYLEGFDGHTGWANSRALALAGITKDTPDPPNGEIVRDPQTGEATGALKEAVANLVVQHIPEPGRERRLAALQQAAELANKLGLTRVVGCGDDAPNSSDYLFLELFEQLQKQDKLTLRFSMSYYVSPQGLTREDWSTIDLLRKQYPPSNDWLSFDAAKLFLDGVIESHTAAMLSPYSDDPSQTGSLRWAVGLYGETVKALDKQGIQIFTHAIGDKAVRTALDSYEAAALANHTSDARHRIEHIETVSIEDIPRFGSLGVIASFQPLHSYPDVDTLNIWLKNAGAERGRRAWAWQSIAQDGGKLAFGSDWPVVTMNPWYGIQTAVTRQTRNGKPPGGFVPEQRLGLEQAIHSYTLGAAIGSRRDKSEGSIEPGKLADLIILSQDLFKLDPHQIYKTRVLLTVVGGKIVYRSPDWRAVNAKNSRKGH